MASEYLKKKYRDVKPDVKRELTPEEKRKNWWDYHKFHVVADIVLHAYSDGDDPQTGMADQTKLMADLTGCESYFFLLEDPEGFQQNYGSLRRLDDSLPESEEAPGEGTYVRKTMIKELNHTFGKLSEKLGIAVPLPNPRKETLKTASLCHFIVGAGLTAAGVVFSSKRCAALGGLGIINSVVLRLESGDVNDKP